MRMRKLRLFQRDSYLSVDYQTRQAAILRRQVGANQRPEIFMEPAQTVDDEPLKLELDAFLHAIASKTPPMVSGKTAPRRWRWRIRSWSRLGPSCSGTPSRRRKNERHECAETSYPDHHRGSLR